jgi:sec-independent protein translocase protein TatA
MNTMLAVFGLGGWEIVLILAVVLIFFGAKKLPELAKGLGSGLKEFKKATREVTDEIQNAADDKAQPQNKSASIAPAQPAQTISQSSAPQSSTPPKA